MRILYCIQRYGPAIIGGAEQHCRQFAEQMVARGHQVEVVTSCATNYSDWSNEFTPGTEVIDGVTVHRLPVASPRDNERFSPLHVHMTTKIRSPLFEQRRWARMIGPELVGFERWLAENAHRFDIVIPYSYPYTTSTIALENLFGVVPLAFTATAHDEPMLRIPIFQTVMRWPDRFLFLTPEEQVVVEERFHRLNAGDIIGQGLRLDSEPTELIRQSFQRRYDLGDEPFFLYIGRADPLKGFHELVSFFRLFKSRNRLPHRLVMIGGTDPGVQSDDDIRILGYVDEPDKWAALAGATALIHPSYQESLSMVLCEAWSQRTPVVVQNACEVLRGQTVRSRGGLRFANYAEFEQCLLWLTEDPSLAAELGESGRRYVEDNYTWSVVMEDYERALESTISAFQTRHPRPLPTPRISG